MNEKRIWDFLMEKIGNPCGVAGLMGNLYAESGLNPINLQNTYERKLRMTDEAYTKAVDSGKYKAGSFIHDSAGYGLAQWTYHTRKEKLLLFAKKCKASIGDLDMQLEYLWQELQGYKGVVKVLCEAKSVRKASDAVLTQYERPANQGESVKKRRASFGQRYFDQFANQTDEENEGGDDDMINSEAENAWDVPEDMVFVLDATGNPVRLEVEDDVDDQA